MNKSFFYIFSFMLCAVCGRVGAQTLTLDECVNKALEHNRSLSSAKLKLEQTRFDSRVYKANTIQSHGHRLLQYRQREFHNERWSPSYI